MSKNPGTVKFDQPNHGTTGTSTGKNPGKVPFEQPNKGTGKTSSKKTPTKLPFTQKTAAVTKSTTGKNPGKADFVQPSKGGSAPMPKTSTVASTANAKMTKQKAGKPVAPKTAALKKFKSTDDLVAYRKKKYGV